ncbi:ankyrin repeat domain-containing protein [Paenibacillus silvisoli]|uniref:ankyrin repeat domain-containing protein n=1 Tax=Paenibacillus silvisoli TaxID=3110539 RepID=UPI002804B7EF|nr:ankyrin repeat domain-containing protein [Paenibacillus silvisoli]
MSCASDIDNQARDESLSEVYPAAYEAVKEGQLEQLKALLSTHPTLANARSKQGRTLLNHLCDWPGHYPNQLETGRALLEAGADVNARAIDPERGETSLQWAASNGDVEMAAFLLDAGSPVDGLNDDRRPLAQALWYGCPNVARLLVERGAALDLELAAAVGRADLLPSFFGADGKLLPSAGVHREPVNATTPSPPEELLQQALIYAAIGGSYESAAYLLDRGADVNGVTSGFDHTGGAPLHWAAAGTNTALVRLLVERGAELNARDRRYFATPLGWANHFKRTEHEELLRGLGGV